MNGNAAEFDLAVEELEDRVAPSRGLGKSPGLLNNDQQTDVWVIDFLL